PAWEEPGGGGRQRQADHVRSALLQLGEGQRLSEGEPTHGGPAQRGEVAPNAEPGAEVSGERPHVRAGGAVDLDVDVGDLHAGHGRPAERYQVQAEDGDAARRQLDLFSGADPPVGALTV